MAWAEKRGNGPTPWRARYLKPDGTVGTEPGFPTKQEAKNWGNDQESAMRGGRWIDPEKGLITLDEYFAMWLPAQDLGDSTVERYTSYYRTHLAPRWGDTSLVEIEPLHVKAFEKELRARRKSATADGVMMVLRMMLEDAAYEKRIGMSPVAPKRRRGKVTVSDEREGVAITLAALIAIMARLSRDDGLLVLVKCFTGMRWGEVAGMRRRYLILDPGGDGQEPSGYYLIDDKDGALKENNKGELSFGEPKNRRGRTVELPPFLVLLLLEHLSRMPRDRDVLFVNGEGQPHRRSNFNRRVWRPACDGWPERKATRGHRGRDAAPPIVTGLHIHDLRHTQETWMSDDHVQKIARDERLGHATPGMEGRYNHATPQMRKDILRHLQRRWEELHAPEKMTSQIPPS